MQLVSCLKVLPVIGANALDTPQKRSHGRVHSTIIPAFRAKDYGTQNSFMNLPYVHHRILREIVEEKGTSALNCFDPMDLWSYIVLNNI